MNWHEYVPGRKLHLLFTITEKPIIANHVEAGAQENVKQLKPLQVLAISAISLMIIPAVVFVGTALLSGMGISGTVAAVSDQYTAGKVNLLVVSLVGLIPLLLIAILVFVRKLMRKPQDGTVAYTWSGVIPVLVVALFVNLEYWPSYLPARQFLGFPHGLEFVIGPLVFAPVGILIGFLAVFLIRRRS